MNTRGVVTSKNEFVTERKRGRERERERVIDKVRE